MHNYFYKIKKPLIDKMLKHKIKVWIISNITNNVIFYPLIKLIIILKAKLILLLNTHSFSQFKEA